MIEPTDSYFTIQVSSNHASMVFVSMTPFAGLLG